MSKSDVLAVEEEGGAVVWLGLEREVKRVACLVLAREKPEESWGCSRKCGKW